MHLDLVHLRRLCCCSRLWNGLATPYLYQLCAAEHQSYSIIWASRHGVEPTTDTAIRIVETSVAFSGNVNTTYYDHTGGFKARPIHYAVGSGSQRLVEVLLSFGAKPYWDLEWSFDTWLRETTPWAARLNDTILGWAHEPRHGYSAAGQAPRSFSPLFLAWMRRDVGMANLLIRHGASEHTTPDSSILHVIAKDKSDDFDGWAHLFNKFNRVINNRLGSSRQTVLHVAARRGNLRAVKQALMADADTDVMDTQNHTPIMSALSQCGLPRLHMTAYQDVIRCVSWLVKSGARVDPEGATKSPLSAAIECLVIYPETRQETMDLIKLLLEKGADINRNGSEALATLCFHLTGVPFHPVPDNDLSKNLYNYLLSQGADVAMLNSGPRSRSLLRRALLVADGERRWIFQKLWQAGVILQSNEVNEFFLDWIKSPLFYSRGKKFNMWQYSAVISPDAVNEAYKFAMKQDTDRLYMKLLRSPLAKPAFDTLLQAAYSSDESWPWESLFGNNRFIIDSMGDHGFILSYYVVFFFLYRRRDSEARAAERINRLFDLGVGDAEHWIKVLKRLKRESPRFRKSKGPLVEALESAAQRAQAEQAEVDAMETDL